LVDVRNLSIFTENNVLGVDKSIRLVYNIIMINNSSTKEITMIPVTDIYDAYLKNADNVISLQVLGKGLYLLHMVGDMYPVKLNSYAVMSVLDPELDGVDMQCALAEYEYYEANWQDIDSDDGHRELYID